MWAAITLVLTVQYCGASEFDTQRAFEKVVCEFQERFWDAPNDAAQGLLKFKRDQEFQTLLNNRTRFEQWDGIVVETDSTSSGKVYFAVQIGCRSRLQTWNNEFSDILDSTLINRSDPNFEKVLNLGVGDKVSVSGRFIPTGDIKIGETSLTSQGSIMNPEFLVVFKTINKTAR
jgi:hypothetical protein